MFRARLPAPPSERVWALGEPVPAPASSAGAAGTGPSASLAPRPRPETAPHRARTTAPGDAAPAVVGSVPADPARVRPRYARPGKPAPERTPPHSTPPVVRSTAPA